MNKAVDLKTRLIRVIATPVLLLLVAAGLQSCSSVPIRLGAPAANLLSLSILEASSEGQLFAFSVQLVNPNEVEIPVTRLDFDIRFGGEGRLIGEHGTAFTIPARGSETVEVEAFSQLVSSASRLLAFTEGPENLLAYEFHGELVLDAVMRDPLEMFRRGQVSLEIAPGVQ
jgi:LEA14-like dessication related protein